VAGNRGTEQGMVAARYAEETLISAIKPRSSPTSIKDTGRRDLDVYPNIVGKSDNPNNPVEKQRIDAPPGFPRKTDQEFYNNKVQEYMDEGDDLETARARAGNDLAERQLPENYTREQLDDALKQRISDEGSISKSDLARQSIGATDENIRDIDTGGLGTLNIDTIIKKKGGQITKSKPLSDNSLLKLSLKTGGQINKNMKKNGNDLVASLYD